MNDFETVRAALPWRDYGMESPGDVSLNEAIAALDRIEAEAERLRAENDTLRSFLPDGVDVAQFEFEEVTPTQTDP